MLNKRIRNQNLFNKVVSPETAVAIIKDGMTIGTAGGMFTAGPRAVFGALADRARKGEIKDINLWACSLLCREIDGAMAEAGALSRRLGSITDSTIRKKINSGEICGHDIKAEGFPHFLRTKSFRKLDVAVVEAVAITEEGHIIPACSLLEAGNQVEMADIVIVELNKNLPLELEGMHDVYLARQPGEQREIPFYNLGDRVGTPYIPAGKEKITYIVESMLPEKYARIQPILPESEQMAQHLLDFIRREIMHGRLKPELFPLSSGLGNATDAVLKLLSNSEFTELNIFSPVLGDGVIELIDSEKCTAASGPALWLSEHGWRKFCGDIQQTHSPG
ncbi:MAG: hypothetical protein M1445_09440 [Bacteroidetes bacterium]|nr:hypothetical protein [Bacteroidota bacterium]